ncbi:MAG TPA: hypothetical protein VF653_19540 [Methylomirabilota bacterium]
MKTIEYRSADKQEWGPGPWQDEPDKKQWADETTGLPCLIVRNTAVTGALCGYVGVARGHPAYEKACDDVPVAVHGGLTYSDRCTPEADPSRHICHVVEPGEDDDVWWLGFDCAHAFDISPKMRRHAGEVYRDWAYVEREVLSLAEQLAAMVSA